MNGLDPIPHLKIAKMAPETPLGCPACKVNFKAKDGFCFLTHWHITDERGGRDRKAGYLCFDKLSCILRFVNDEESGHC